MRLSKLEKHIIVTIANHIINTLECSENDGNYWEHDNQQFLNVSDLYRLAYSYYEPDETQRLIDWHPYGKNLNKYKAAMSRCVHNLHKKGIINALALCWIFLQDTHEEQWNWQGGGRNKIKKTDNFNYKDDTPTFKCVGLTQLGWKIAREITDNEDLGKCEHVLISKELEHEYF